jgi:hypothetical protein
VEGLQVCIQIRDLSSFQFIEQASGDEGRKGKRRKKGTRLASRSADGTALVWDVSQ